MTKPVVLAVDGGNSKTDLAAIGPTACSRMCAVRSSSPHHLGLDACLELLQQMLDDAVALAGLTLGRGWPRSPRSVFLAGVDFPAEGSSAPARRRGAELGRPH